MDRSVAAGPVPCLARDRTASVRAPKPLHAHSVSRPAYVRSMGRPLRYLAAGAYYHVGTAATTMRRSSLDDWDRTVFFHILRRVERRYGWRTHARCLLGNHYHLVVETPLPNLSDGMRDLNGGYARAFNERHSRRRSRLRPPLLVQGDRVRRAVRPHPRRTSSTTRLHHGFVRRLGQWRWTSGTAVSGIDSPGVARHRQADPSALARRLPDGRAPALTARDVKSNVEGYSEMSDEAFARRFYSDRAELLALGVPLQSQRDEFTGEELYTLRSENYFLAELELEDDELAALQTALYLLEGTVRLLGATAVGTPEPRARPARASANRRRTRPFAWRCSTPTTRRRCRGDWGSSRERSPNSARSSFRTTRSPVTAKGTNGQPVRPALGQRQLVRDRPGSRPQRHPNLPRLPHPR